MSSRGLCRSRNRPADAGDSRHHERDRERAGELGGGEPELSLHRHQEDCERVVENAPRHDLRRRKRTDDRPRTTTLRRHRIRAHHHATQPLTNTTLLRQVVQLTRFRIRWATSSSRDVDGPAEDDAIRRDPNRVVRCSAAVEVRVPVGLGRSIGAGRQPAGALGLTAEELERPVVLLDAHRGTRRPTLPHSDGRLAIVTRPDRALTIRPKRTATATRATIASAARPGTTGPSASRGPRASARAFFSGPPPTAARKARGHRPSFPPQARPVAPRERARARPLSTKAAWREAASV